MDGMVRFEFLPQDKIVEMGGVKEKDTNVKQIIVPSIIVDILIRTYHFSTNSSSPEASIFRQDKVERNAI